MTVQYSKEQRRGRGVLCHDEGVLVALAGVVGRVALLRVASVATGFLGKGWEDGDEYTYVTTMSVTVNMNSWVGRNRTTKKSRSITRNIYTYQYVKMYVGRIAYLEGRGG